MLTANCHSGIVRDFSAIVPIQNMANRLEKLFSWLPTADDLNIEVIVVCNACVDDTTSQIELFVRDRNLTNVKVVENFESGPGNARNYGLKLAEGNFTVFWDSDDIPNPSNLLELLPELEGVDALIAGYSLESSDDNQLDKTTSSMKQNDFHAFAMNPGIWRCVFRTLSIKNVYFGTSRMGEDQVFIANFLKKDPKLKFSDLEIYRYFVSNPHQLTSNKKNMRGLISSATEIKKILGSNPNEYATIVKTFFIRQCLTGIKRGEARVKVAMTIIFLRAIVGKKESRLVSFDDLKILILKADD